MLLHPVEGNFECPPANYLVTVASKVGGRRTDIGHSWAGQIGANGIEAGVCNLVAVQAVFDWASTCTVPRFKKERPILPISRQTALLPAVCTKIDIHDINTPSHTCTAWPVLKQALLQVCTDSAVYLWLRQIKARLR